MRRITKKPQLVTQGPNKGKYAIERFVGGNYERIFLTKAQAEDYIKLKKVILDDKTGKPLWPDLKREKEFIKDLKKKLKYPRGKLTPVELRAGELAKKYPEITARQVERATRYYRENLNLEYTKGLASGDPTGKKIAAKRRTALKKYSDLTTENRLRGNEKFHKSHMSDLYTRDVRTGTMGYAKAKINMEDLDNFDAKMNSLYKKADKLLKDNPKDFAIKMDEINMKGTNLAAQSGGYKKFEAIDPITKNRFVINFSSAAQELDPTDILENKTLKELKLADKSTIQTLKEASMENIKNVKVSVDTLVKKTVNTPGGCQAVVKRALGAKGGLFGETCEKIIRADPERAAVKLNNAITATKGPLKNLKDDSQKLIRLFRGESFPQRNVKAMKDSAKHFGTTLAEMKKDKLSGQWYTPEQSHAAGYLSKPGQMKYVDVTPAELEAIDKFKTKVNQTNVKFSEAARMGKPFKQSVTTSPAHKIIPRYKLKQMEEAGRLKTKLDINPFTNKGAVESAEGVLEWNSVRGGFVDSANPSEIVGQNQIKAWAADNPIDVKVGTEIPKPNKSVLKTVGKTLAHIGAPLPTALIDGYFINKQMDEGMSTAEIAKDPLNWLGLATMEPLTKMAGANAPGGLNAVLRLGLNPATIRGITRFAGLPGLAISTAMTAYDQYKKYQNEEGFVYNLFNKEGT